MSLGDTCLLPRWCPARSWRESGPGSGMERGNLRPDTDDRSLDSWSPGRESETSKRQNPQGAE